MKVLKVASAGLNKAKGKSKNTGNLIDKGAKLVKRGELTQEGLTKKIYANLETNKKFRAVG